MAIKDKSGTSDKIDLTTTGPEHYDGSEAPRKPLSRALDGDTIACTACGKEANWDNSKMAKGWRCENRHLTRPGQ